MFKFKKLSIYLFITMLAFVFMPNQIKAASVTLPEIGTIVEGRTLVPLRAIFEELEATVRWEQSNQTVMVTKGNTKIILKVGSNKATVNGKNVTIDVPAQIIQSRTYVPLRFVSQSLGATVGWNSTDRIATINTANKTIIVKVQTPYLQDIFKIGEKGRSPVSNVSVGMTRSEIERYLGKPLDVGNEEWGAYSKYNNIFVEYEHYLHELTYSSEVLSLLFLPKETITYGMLEDLKGTPPVYYFSDYNGDGWYFFYPVGKYALEFGVIGSELYRDTTISYIRIFSPDPELFTGGLGF